MTATLINLEDNMGGTVMAKIIMRTIAAPLLFFAVAFSQGEARAQETANRLGPPSVRATAEAIVVAKPDQAQIDIGVVTQAANARAAADENARKLDLVIAAIRKLLGQDADIKTIS